MLQEGRARGAVVDIMREVLATLPLYVWLVALPQLTSRVCHPHAETQKFTQHVLTRVTQAFPHQARRCCPRRCLSSWRAHALLRWRAWYGWPGV